VTLADSLVVELRAQIVSGQLSPGQLLPSEHQLTEAFGVGRTTVREALRGLVVSGFASRRGNRLVVADPQTFEPDQMDYAALAARVSVRDLYETRKLIEVPIAQRAAEHWTGGELDHLRQLLKRTEAPHDDAFQGADAEFHDAIAGVCGNQVLTAVFRNSRRLFFRLPSYWRLFPHVHASVNPDGPSEHRMIFDAIAARDPEAAGEAMLGHLERMARDVLSRLDRTAGHDHHAEPPDEGQSMEVRGIAPQSKRPGGS